MGSMENETYGPPASLPPFSQAGPVAPARRQAILYGKPADFGILGAYDADGERPLHSLGFMSDVNKYKDDIDKAAKKEGVDPDLVKSIVYLETTQGWYDRLPALFDKNKSIRPMNIETEYWKDLGYSREELKDPAKNIEAGTKLLAKIQSKMPGASISEIASVYNSLGARKVSDYGLRIQNLYDEKPWEK